MRALTLTGEPRPAFDPVMSESRDRAAGPNELGERGDSHADLASHTSSIVLDGPGLSAYSEEAFKYLLAIERKRAERSGRPFFLLLVDLRRASGESPAMSLDVASCVFAGLAGALRDTDFTGWYREGRIAGAVLAQLTDATGELIDQAVGQRVRAQLAAQLPAAVADRLQTRVFQIPRPSRS
jgi:hypothetical protein